MEHRNRFMTSHDTTRGLLDSEHQLCTEPILAGNEMDDTLSLRQINANRIQHFDDGKMSVISVAMARLLHT